MTLTTSTLSHSVRAVEDLAADLDWLAEYLASQRQQNHHHAAEVRLASGLTRNVLRPYLQASRTAPLHIAVVGGAGTGKSSVANLLIGRPLAEANPQAGFTRHPVAYVTQDEQADWWNVTSGFLAPLRRLHVNQPANLDENVFQVRKYLPVLGDDELFRDAVVWDCPDVTTWHSLNYLPRVLEIVSLADVVVYVASDERYNDEVPTKLLRLILETGKAVVCVLTKMRESEVQQILKHFRSHVLDKLPEAHRVVDCIAVPFLEPRVLADPANQACHIRERLLSAIRRALNGGEKCRVNTVRGAIHFLKAKEGELLASVNEDLAALRTWNDLVEKGRAELQARYFREYLSGKKFHRFDQSFLKLIQLLELPGVGKYLSKAVAVARLPWQLGKQLLTRLVGSSATQEMPEEKVLQTALASWLDHLQVEVSRRSSKHPLFSQLEQAFRSNLRQEIEQRYRASLPELRRGLEEEVERTARAIYEDIEKNPALLNSLRGIKFSVEALTIISILVAGGINIWDPILIIIITPLVQEITEFFGKQYVDTRKAEARQRQLQLMDRTVATPLKDYLVSWPKSHGSQFNRLEQIAERLSQHIGQVYEAVRSRLGERAA
ncbi:MAG: GTPase domain-containing protein [Gemmatales bacterium]|nr:GTPase domain-containing protein [Gemmatales bacterium]MDW8387349.1 GTPase domain-containing protein [Gemmatales bacterium]